MNALASLPSSDLQEMKEEDHGKKSLVNSAKRLTTLMKTPGVKLIRDKSVTIFMIWH